MSNQNIIEQAKSLCIRPADLWNKVEVIDGQIHVDSLKADSFQDGERFKENRRHLKFLGWRTEFTGTGWILTPPAPAPEPLKAGASPVERAKRILAKPAEAWNRATIADDNRTVHIPASRNPYENHPLESDLSQLRRAGWSVGENKGVRGVDSYVAVAPIEKVAPKTLQEALKQVPGAGRNASQTKWVDEAEEVDGSLAFTSDHSLASRNAAQATAPRARANGWDVVEIAVVGATPHRIEYTPPKGLIR